ncbi:MAG: zinc-ribbon domain-containing protein [Chloroflexi bacterium]|nr:zinc-ribbon domain-containing protein [Chloroflexota bacterium]MBI3339966.1 zinc-ribbon domain-containing protein [Chloroflexota bacterium]
MDIGAILLLLALLLGIGLYLAAPLMNNRARRGREESQETSSLMAERDRVVNSLQELDFDFKLGKIPEEDYPIQRAELLQKGAGILKKLDALTPTSPFGPDAEARLEKAAAHNPDSAPAKDEPLSDDKIESMLAARRKTRASKSAGFCPRCGKPVQISDQFCPACGKGLQ